MNSIPSSREDQLRTCLRITELLISHPLSALFMNPVDPVRDDAPGYYEKVKNPITLPEVKKKLTDNLYKSTYDWKNDIDLIWSNAILYNGEASVVSRIAKYMEDVAHKYIVNKLPQTTYDWIDNIGTYVGKLKANYAYAQSNNEKLAPINAQNREKLSNKLILALKELADDEDRVNIGRILALFDVKYTSNEENTINLREVPYEALDLLIMYAKFRFAELKLHYPD